MTEDLNPVSVPPETHSAFRRGQLLLLLEQFERPVTVDRLGYLEFFSANPYLVHRADSSERTQLQLAGFNPKALSYQASTERFANRRTRLRSDLGALVAWGLASTTSIDGFVACQLTEIGRTRAASFTSLYADAYRLSVRLIRPKMRGLSSAGLAKLVQQWLRVDEFRVDLLDIHFSYDGELQGRLL